MKQKHETPPRKRYENFAVEIRPNGTLRVATINDEPSMAHDEYREQSDVNYVMAKFQKTGEITFSSKQMLNKLNEEFDTTKIPDYRQAMETIALANSTFESLPAEIRKKFDNDPAVMIDYLNDEKNTEEAIKLGLIELKDVPNDQKILNELKTQNSQLKTLNEKTHQDKGTKNQKIKTDDD